MAGTHSGVGKTTVATGLMAALRRRGTAVAAAKVGPDFIDPGYHALATGRPARNLDAWICGVGAVAPLAARAAHGAELLVVEGVMGLFDGAAPPPAGGAAAGSWAGTASTAGPPGTASTAEAAGLLRAPVVLVVDASSMSTSVAALVHGFSTYDPAVRPAGVILNKVGSASHEALLRRALAPLEVPVLGALHRDDRLAWRDRHLGLVPVVENPGAVAAALDRLAAAVAESCDLTSLVALASSAAPLAVAPLPGARPTGPARIAVAGGSAFSFSYPDNLERLTEAGAELLAFDPASDPTLPGGTQGLYAGGGFPEVFLERLSANVALLSEVRSRARAGMVTWAECGGLLWLTRALDSRPLCGVLPAEARMTKKLSLGYRRARTLSATPVAPGGSEQRGHEFHYSVVDPPGRALSLEGRSGSTLGGFASPTLLASYLHLHLGADPAPAERFVAAAASGGTGPSDIRPQARRSA